MITTLHIKNIGIIEDITVDFNNGFNALTGETGAGKTLIIDSLAIIAGGRFSKEMIRKGESNSFVEASIYMPTHPLSIDGTIIVSREIYADGRNSCKINGRLTTVSELKNFMADIIDIHGQNDNQTLMNVSKHINYFDDFIGEEILKIKKEYEEEYKKYINIKNNLQNNYGDDKERQRKLDMLLYQLTEINNANLKINEDELLEEQRKLASNSERILENLNTADNEINITVLQGLTNAIKAIEKIETLGTNYQTCVSTLRTAYYDIEEAHRDILSSKDMIDFDEESRDEIETRLDIINSLKRKYGNTIAEILQYSKTLQTEIDTLENMEETVKQQQAQLQQVTDKMNTLATQMNTTRVKYAEIISNKINKELKELEMKDAKFAVAIENKEEFTPNGLDKIEFKISTNVGEEYKPLAKIASGGEISRVTLAIKTVLADTDKIPTMIFDEIDAGISGKAAKAVSEKMKKIAENHQIFVVTHLAIIAANAKNNFYISKETNNNKTKTNVKKLTEQETIQEIARILTGDITEAALQHAMELRYETKIGA